MANQNSPNAHRRNRMHIKSTRNPRNRKTNCLKSLLSCIPLLESLPQSLERGSHKDWRARINDQSLKRGSHKDWRARINGQSLKRGSGKDWGLEINGQSLKRGSHEDRGLEINAQSLKRGSGKDWGGRTGEDVAGEYSGRPLSRPQRTIAGHNRGRRFKAAIANKTQRVRAGCFVLRPCIMA